MTAFYLKLNNLFQILTSSDAVITNCNILDTKGLNEVRQAQLISVCENGMPIKGLVWTVLTMI